MNGRPVLRGAAVGFLLGVGWGVLARLFMRLFSDDPSFTWAGTLTILGMSGVLGLGLGVVHGARTAGRSRWWGLAPVPGLVLFASPGIVLLVVFVAGLAAGRCRTIARRALWLGGGVLLTVSPEVVAAVVEVDPADLAARSLLDLLPGVGVFTVAAALLGLGAMEWSLRRPPLPTIEVHRVEGTLRHTRASS